MYVWERVFSHYGSLHLGVEMADVNITLNCLIVPIGKLMNIPCVKVMQAITVEKDDSYIMLEAIIQSRLGVETPLKLCIIQAGSNSEKVMDSRTPISEYFTEEPKAEHFHITVYPRSE
jgi:hypothetical protein